MRRPQILLVGLAALFVLAGGAVHLREWAQTYRHVPDAIPGADVVRLGFPLQAVASVAAAAALVWQGRRRWWWAAALGAAALQAGSAAAVVLSRHGTLLGWRETGWTKAATMSLALAAAALVLLGLRLVLGRR